MESQEKIALQSDVVTLRIAKSLLQSEVVSLRLTLQDVKEKILQYQQGKEVIDKSLVDALYFIERGLAGVPMPGGGDDFPQN